jgi:anti-anti-sigma factor
MRLVEVGLRAMIMNAKTGMDIVAAGKAAIAVFKSTCVSDVQEISKASAQVRAYIETNWPDRMIFDFSGVKFFSSQVLGLLLEARARLRARGGQVVVCTLGGRLHRVFKITNLDSIFAFYPDRQAALGEPATGQ